MSLKPWREIAVPHEVVLKGTFQQAEFAADLAWVASGDERASRDYRDPVLFFQRTFITEGMRLLLNSVVKRLAGKGGDPVIQLQTAFGGGKTHTMLAVYHLAKGAVAASEMQGIPAILNEAGIVELPSARIAVLDGNTLSPSQPRQRGAHTVRTMWGELAWQLGGEEAYERIKESDLAGTSPGKETLAELLRSVAPCVILVDELVAYIRQFDEGRVLPGGSYDSNLSFLQALTEALKMVPNAVLLASLPQSEKEAGSQHGVNALRTLEHYFGRVQALWKPVATEESFEIVRRRLFSQISDSQASEAVCRAFADMYTDNGGEFPHETQESGYYQRLLQAYPIHPEVFDRLYEDWSSLDSFQRTRGVLKLMAKVIHRLWQDGNNDLLIMPGSLPLYDSDTRNEAIYYLPQGWDPVLERDIDGNRAETTGIESRDPRLGSVHACRRTARAIFLGSAPSGRDQAIRGLEPDQVLLGAVQPGQQLGIFKDALRRLTDRLHYLNQANNHFWFDTRPNLRREMEDRKRRFHDAEDVIPCIQTLLERSLAQGIFGGRHVFAPSNDIPDDWQLRLVVLPPGATYSKTAGGTATTRAQEILRNRGEQPRQKQNRLLFLAPEQDSVDRLKDQVRSVLAWESIISDYQSNRLTLDNLMAKAAQQQLEAARQTQQRLIRDTYRWLLVPVQEPRPGKGISELTWEAYPLNAGSQYFTPEIEKVLKENELVIFEWSPIHLSRLLKDWFWKDGAAEANALDLWQKSCQYLYLPRLKDDNVYRNAIAAGAPSRDFFGLAYAKEGDRYSGFSLGQATTPLLETLLLIEPATAAAFEQRLREEAATVESPEPIKTPPTVGPGPLQVREESTPAPVKGAPKRRFYGTVQLDPMKAKLDFSQIMEEVVLQFSSKPGVKVRISVEIEAESPAGFDEGLQRAVRENSHVLRFNNAEFDD